MPHLTNALSVDVEDYFHVSAFESVTRTTDWDRMECRVERNTERLLDLFASRNARATFFFLGWVAERHPSLVKRVVREGHEIASHGYGHVRVTTQTEPEFREDVHRTRVALEDIAGDSVVGYRAASFSISADNDWAHRVLRETGHAYSSSSHPIHHDRYGMPDGDRRPHFPGQAGLPEIPVTTLQLGRWRLPCAGGGYFRLLPYRWAHWCIERVNRLERIPAVFYLHPWEIDPGQPRLDNLSPASRFRHYVNLHSFEAKLDRLLRDFNWAPIREVFAGHIRPDADGIDHDRDAGAWPGV